MDTDKAVRASAGLMELQQSLTLKALQESHEVLALRVDAMAIELTQNTAATQRVEVNTAEIVEIFGAMKGGFKVLGWLGTVGQKLLWIGVPAAALVAWWQTLQAHLPAWLGGPK